MPASEGGALRRRPLGAGVVEAGVRECHAPEVVWRCHLGGSGAARTRSVRLPGLPDELFGQRLSEQLNSSNATPRFPLELDGASSDVRR